ncbi:MAG: tetraacyldisaccharide 4'-kinase [Deltaproteobacteria bacterium]|nr:tetraacyldisaccharide 4'-kinase [Deltaproteobacteria bacterium]
MTKQSWLAPLSWFYGFAVRCRVFAYKKGWALSTKLPVPVISIGNLTVGGTGKTPAVIALARWIREELRKEVAILSRGYKRKDPDSIRLVSPNDSVEEVGDEPLLMARTLPGIPVVVGKKRVEAAHWALKRFPVDVFLLDDGFQHFRLQRDLDMVLIDGSSFFGNRRLLPIGPWREPLSALQRADFLCLTRVDEVDRMDSTIVPLRRVVPTRPILRSCHRPKGFWALRVRKMEELNRLKGKRILAVCGIAQPDSFMTTLGKLGAKVVQPLPFPDHYFYRDRDWKRILEMARAQQVDAIVTTEKDAMRLDRFSSDIPVWVLAIEWEVTEGWPLLEKRIRALFS